MANTNVPQIPVDIQAEKLLLSDILGFPDDTREVVSKLTPNYFYYKPHQIIFTVYKRLLSIGKTPDYVLLLDSIKKLGKAPVELTDDYLNDICSISSTLENIEDRYKIVREKYLLRSLIEAGQKVVTIGNTATDADEGLEEAIKEINELTEKTDTKSMVDAETVFNQTFTEIIDNQRGEHKKGINTGFSGLDATIKGLNKGELILVAARPSVGKTAFALNIISNIVRDYKDKVVAMFSLEMSASLLMKRMLSYSLELPLSAMGKEKGLGVSQINLIKDFKRNYIGVTEDNKKIKKVYFDDTAVLTPLDVQTKCQKLKRDVGLDLIVIDYLQLMNSEKSTKSKNEEVSDITRKLKVLARKFDVPILLLSQVSRASDARGIKDHSHRLSDLRDSGAIEQDADVVMFIYKPSQYDETAHESQIILQVKKNRNGQQKDIDMIWNGNLTAFSEGLATAELQPSTLIKEENSDFNVDNKEDNDTSNGDLEY